MCFNFKFQLRPKNFILDRVGEGYRIYSLGLFSVYVLNRAQSNGKSLKQVQAVREKHLNGDTGRNKNLKEMFTFPLNYSELKKGGF